MARYKGDFGVVCRSAAVVDSIKDGDRILISEGCTHHRQCGDIGTVKIPKWLTEFTSRDLVFETASGTGYPDDLTQYALVVHCGGCMLNEKEMTHRMEIAERAGVPMVNYGVAIAHIHGILKKSLAPFPDVAAMLN